jgi:uncharacterized protein (DUF3820 family)
MLPDFHVTIAESQLICSNKLGKIFSGRNKTRNAMTPELLQKLVLLEMPYGKYKGRLLADLPGNYLGWFAREGFPKGELGNLLALMYELDHNALRHLLDPLRQR